MSPRKGKTQPNAANRLPARDPFEAAPRVAPDVDVDTDAEGLVHARRRIIPRSKIMRAVERRFGWRRNAYVYLDAQGSFFWRQIDGRRTLAAIAKAIAKEMKVDDEQSREATLRFTRDLMARGLIQLAVPAPPGKGGAK